MSIELEDWNFLTYMVSCDIWKIMVNMGELCPEENYVNGGKLCQKNYAPKEIQSS